eukprot:ANDGO_07441.mRNA.1 hypothetical protein
MPYVYNTMALAVTKYRGAAAKSTPSEVLAPSQADGPMVGAETYVESVLDSNGVFRQLRIFFFFQSIHEFPSPGAALVQVINGSSGEPMNTSFAGMTRDMMFGTRSQTGPPRKKFRSDVNEVPTITRIEDWAKHVQRVNGIEVDRTKIVGVKEGMIKDYGGIFNPITMFGMLATFDSLGLCEVNNPQTDPLHYVAGGFAGRMHIKFPKQNCVVFVPPDVGMTWDDIKMRLMPHVAFETRDAEMDTDTQQQEEFLQTFVRERSEMAQNMDSEQLRQLRIRRQNQIDQLGREFLGGYSEDQVHLLKPMDNRHYATTETITDEKILETFEFTDLYKLRTSTREHRASVKTAAQEIAFSNDRMKMFIRTISNPQAALSSGAKKTVAHWKMISKEDLSRKPFAVKVVDPSLSIIENFFAYYFDNLTRYEFVSNSHFDFLTCWLAIFTGYNTSKIGDTLRVHPLICGPEDIGKSFLVDRLLFHSNTGDRPDSRTNKQGTSEYVADYGWVGIEKRSGVMNRWKNGKTNQKSVTIVCDTSNGDRKSKAFLTLDDRVEIVCTNSDISGRLDSPEIQRLLLLSRTGLRREMGSAGDAKEAETRMKQSEKDDQEHFRNMLKSVEAMFILYEMLLFIDFFEAQPLEDLIANRTNALLAAIQKANIKGFMLRKADQIAQMARVITIMETILAVYFVESSQYYNKFEVLDAMNAVHARCYSRIHHFVLAISLLEDQIQSTHHSTVMAALSVLYHRQLNSGGGQHDYLHKKAAASRDTAPDVDVNTNQHNSNAGTARQNRLEVYYNYIDFGDEASLFEELKELFTDANVDMSDQSLRKILKEFRHQKVEEYTFKRPLAFENEFDANSVRVNPAEIDASKPRAKIPIVHKVKIKDPNGPDAKMHVTVLVSELLKYRDHVLLEDYDFSRVVARLLGYDKVMQCVAEVCQDKHTVPQKILYLQPHSSTYCQFPKFINISNQTKNSNGQTVSLENEMQFIDLARSTIWTTIMKKVA